MAMALRIYKPKQPYIPKLSISMFLPTVLRFFICRFSIFKCWTFSAASQRSWLLTTKKEEKSMITTNCSLIRTFRLKGATLVWLKFFSTSRSLLLFASILLLFLALFDATFTDFGIRYHYIQEANPLMRSLYEKSILSFYVTKLILPILLFFILLRVEPKPIIHVVLVISLVLYFIVLIQHFLWMSAIARI